MNFRFSIPLLFVLSMSCGTKEPSPEVIMIGDSGSSKNALGKTVQIEGTAQNAKLSAVVISPGMMVYCLDRAEWPADLVGKKVTVRGVLEQTDDFKAVKSPTGEHSAGTMGGDLVLRKSELIR